jgi:hypothetical protein
MNVFISEVCKTMGIPNAHTLNCCRTEGTIIDDSKVGFCITLPDGTAVEIYTPSETSEAAEEGFAYVPDYDIESPDMCAEDLGCWLDESLDCCRRIDAYYASLAGQSTNLNSKLDPNLASRIKNVFKAAQSAVDLPPGFRYTAFREVYDSVVSTLMYRSQKMNEELWIIKSSLSCDDSEAPVDGPGVDDWAFRPNHDPESEGTILKHREGHFLDIENGQYNYTAEGDTADKRDRKAAYWLAGLLSDLMDTVMTDPPARVYHLFLADGTAGISKSKLDSMSKPGLKNLIRRNLVDVEKVLKIKPELAKDLVRDKYITPEVVARRVPELLFWLVQNKYISPDYAVKIDPAIKDKLIRRGLYQVAENVPDDADAIIEGVKNGTFTATDAYRKNPKLLQPLVEQGLITPQEAYKLDASIVTWLLLNKYIGRAEAMKVKPDIQKYIARKYKDVNWDDLDASVNPNEDVELAASKDDDSVLSKVKKAFAKHQSNAKKNEKTIDKATEKIEKKTADIKKTAGLNSSLSFNSDFNSSGELAPESASGHIFEEGDFAPYATGYEKLADTTLQGPGFVAECMLPEDDFDGIVVPGETEEIAKETLMQMLLANDGTFVDWKPIEDIQAFKAENATGNYLVLN